MPSRVDFFFRDRAWYYGRILPKAQHLKRRLTHGGQEVVVGIVITENSALRAAHRSSRATAPPVGIGGGCVPLRISVCAAPLHVRAYPMPRSSTFPFAPSAVGLSTHSLPRTDMAFADYRAGAWS